MSLPLERDASVLNIEKIVGQIHPFDDIEADHIHETLAWIRSGAPIFRLQKPDIPPKHLVSYFVPFDSKTHKILLTAHKKSGLWLPPGGHVDLHEDPQETVRRECQEELGCPAEFWDSDPLFLTSTLTVGPTAGHIDVSFWYVIDGHQDDAYEFNRDEFEAIQWFDFNEIPYEASDPHMACFLKKLRMKL